MIRMLIVDDEAVSREGIMRSIDWAGHGVHMVGQAGNGAEALALCEQLRPDIVLTDIRMPVMDGLQLSQILLERFPDIRPVILTGYGEFEYAQKAVECGVARFILKPIGAEVLVDTVEKLRDEIHQKRKKAQERRNNELLLEENLPVIRAQWLRSLTDGACTAVSHKALLQRAQKLRLDLGGPLYQVFLLAVDEYGARLAGLPPGEREVLLASVPGICDAAFTAFSGGCLVQRERGLFVGVVNASPHGFEIEAVCKQIQRLLAERHALSVSFGIGRPVETLCGLHRSYSEADAALKNRVYCGKGAILRFSETACSDGAVERLLETCRKEEKELLVCLKLLDRKRTGELLERLFACFARMRAGCGDIKSIVINLLLSALKGMQGMGIRIEDHLVHGDTAFFEQLHPLETAQDIQKWLAGVLDDLMDIVETGKNERYKNIVRIAMQYILEHYHKPLSLTAVAEQIYVTPNYFSRVFKKETGMSYVEWLNRYRIEKAKELLPDAGLKTYQIAEMVGFNDYKHFAHNFKKYVGCSLTQYRNTGAQR